MARKKPTQDPTVLVLTDVEADAALAELAVLSRQITGIETKLNADIDKLKKSAAELAAPAHARIAVLEQALLQFGTSQKSVFDDKRRSIELDHGTIGFRRSTELGTQPKWTWAMVLGQLKTLAMVDGIRTKEEVDKTALAQWPDERLTLVGVRRVEKDVFYYEVKQEELTRHDQVAAA